ncbi:RidA family protein [candidate division KSB1 bacterium]
MKVGKVVLYGILFLFLFSLFYCDSDDDEEIITKEVIGSRLPDLPFCTVVRAGNTYYFSGKIPIEEARGDITNETKNIMEAFRKDLESVNLTFKDVVKGTVFITDMDYYKPMNDVYKTYFTSDPPARECVAVKEISGNSLVEISFIAVKTD